jgi:hypothetical protein
VSRTSICPNGQGENLQHAAIFVEGKFRWNSNTQYFHNNHARLTRLPETGPLLKRATDQVLGIAAATSLE